MPRDNDFNDLGRAEDDFNTFLDALARGESTEAIDIDPSLAATAMHVQRMAAGTRPEAHLMYRTWSTVGASAGGETAITLPSTSVPISSQAVTWPRVRQRRGAWRYTNHAALAAVLIVAMLTGYFGFRGGDPGDELNGLAGTSLVATPEIGNAVFAETCDVEGRTVQEIRDVVAQPAPTANSSQDVLSTVPNEQTIAGVQETMRQMDTCAGDLLRYWALFSDDGLRRTVNKDLTSWSDEAVATMEADSANYERIVTSTRLIPQIATQRFFRMTSSF